MKATRLNISGSAEVIAAAETALGSSARILADWQFQKRMGWHCYWTPESCIALAARRDVVRSLVWC